MSKIKCREFGERCPTQFAYAHVKYDGIFVRCAKDEFGAVRCESSQGTDLTEQCRRVPSMKNLWLRVPPCTTIVGELYCPGSPASEVKSRIAKGRHDTLTFAGFAVETMHEDARLEDVDAMFVLWGVNFARWYSRPGTHDPRMIARMFDRNHFIDDQEGWVFKDGNMAQWYKWKPVRTVDGVITGFKYGEGKFLGLIGAIEVSVYKDSPNGTRLVRVANVSGMSDAERVLMTQLEEELVARAAVVEVEYQYVGSGGRLRHPRFKRMRDDKSAEECTWDQLD